MSGYTEVEQLAIPEVFLEDSDAFNAHFASVIAGELPGFVLRQVRIDEMDALGCATTDLLLAHVDPGIAVSKSAKGFMRFGGTDSSADFRFHVDFNDAEPPDTQLNFYIVSGGTVLSTLVPFTLAERHRIQNEPDDTRPELTDRDQDEFKLHRVRKGLLLPQMHTATLSAGDGLVFTDALHAHKFESLTFPRSSIANMLHACLPPGTEIL